jgi:hypothetical protein
MTGSVRQLYDSWNSQEFEALFTSDEVTGGNSTAFAPGVRDKAVRSNSVQKVGG